MTDDSIDEGKLRDLMKEVTALPRSIEPPADAWAKIRAEIEASGTPDRGSEIESHPKRSARIFAHAFAGGSMLVGRAATSFMRSRSFPSSIVSFVICPMPV
jgi:hypothetical protein